MINWKSALGTYTDAPQPMPRHGGAGRFGMPNGA